MKLLIVQKQVFMFFGITGLSGYLKKYGHETDALIEPLEPNFIEKVREFKPDLIGFSVMSNDEQWFLETSQLCKDTFPEVPIMVGGAHTYLCKESVLQYPQIDMVCIGEGEAPVLELFTKMEKGEDYYDVKGICFNKKNGEKVINGPQAPIQNMDDIPEDRDIYIKRYSRFTNEELLQIMSSRGCYYGCTFCINNVINIHYRKLSAIHRQKSARVVVDEIKRLMKDFTKTRTIFFADDLFLANKTYVKGFCELYKEEVGLPFLMNVMPFFIDDEISEMLKEAGCITIQVGTETGNEEHRKRIFRKPTTNEQYINMAKSAKKYGIEVYASNMFVYPKQTLQDAFKTIELIQEMGVEHPFKGFFQPYPGTQIYDIAVEGGYIDPSYDFKDLPQSYFLYSSIDHPEKKEISLVCYFFYFLVKYPKMFHFFKENFWALRMMSPFKTFFNYLGIYLWFKNWKKLSYLSTFMYLWKFRNDK